MTKKSTNGNGSPLGNAHGGPARHEEFLELAAISTTGDLTPEEQGILREHLAACVDCRQALKEFEAVADIGLAMLSPELDPRSDKTNKHVHSQADGFTARWRSTVIGNETNWNFVWLPLAAAIFLTMALGIYAYQFGRGRGVEIARGTLPSPGAHSNSELGAIERQLIDAGHERSRLKTELAARDALISDLRRKMEVQTSALDQMQRSQADLEHSIRAEETSKQQAIAQQRDKLQQDLNMAEASLQTIRGELDTTRQRQSEDQLRAASLETQIKDLNGQLRDREQAVNKDEELLSHDRDIRELMGARDLYIAEVYDVGRDGATQKPYGRVFYTRGKSLVFYAYDLDQQPGAKDATFQAWGRRGPDAQQPLSLGVFYKDTVGKKRWFLKFDDPKMLEQIDAVFVTVQSNGASRKPSGKSLLFAYLNVSANHP